jgi:hypothetical protein
MTKAAEMLTNWEAGEQWAARLQVGDTFRGSHGEADHRGLTGAARQSFGRGALDVLRSVRIWTGAHDNVIARIER